MRILREWIQRLRGTLRAGRPDDDLEEELRFHVEMAAADARRRGRDPADARRDARLRAGGQPAIGRTVEVDGRPHDVIGVMPPGVDLMDTQPEIWLPLGVHPVIRRIRDSHLLNVVGRLKDGVTPEAARTVMFLPARHRRRRTIPCGCSRCERR